MAETWLLQELVFTKISNHHLKKMKEMTEKNSGKLENIKFVQNFQIHLLLIGGKRFFPSCILVTTEGLII